MGREGALSKFTGKKVVPYDYDQPVSPVANTKEVPNGTATGKYRKKTTSLLQELKIRAVAYKHAAKVFAKWHHMLVGPAVVISVFSTIIAMMWPRDEHISALLRTISAIAAANVALTCFSSLLRFQSKSDMCSSAAMQYDSLVASLTFNVWNENNSEKVTLVKLGADAERRDLEIRQNTFNLPFSLEEQCREEAKRLCPVPRKPPPEKWDTDAADAAKTSEMGMTFFNKIKKKVDVAADKDDRKKLVNVQKSLTIERGKCLYVSSYYHKTQSSLTVATIVISATTAGLAAGWSADIKLYKNIATLLCLMTTVLLAASILGKYQSKADSAASAAAQFDALLTKVEYMAKYRMKIMRSEVNKLVLDSNAAATNITKVHGFTELPHFLQQRAAKVAEVPGQVEL